MKKKDKGFTIIEIALVLAIAGAIFAAVFIALRGVWADERDGERRDDMISFIRQLKNYQTNNARGALPGSSSNDKDSETMKNQGDIHIKGYNETTGLFENVNSDRNSDTSWYSFYTTYFRDNFTDPDGVKYNLRVRECKAAAEKSCGLGTPEPYTIEVIIGANCYGEDAVGSKNSRNVAVMYDMEVGGYYCENT